MERRTHINERLRTEFANSGRAAGIGTLYDDYGDESCRPCYNPATVRVRMPSDSLTPEERGSLNGEVKIIQPARKKKTFERGPTVNRFFALLTAILAVLAMAALTTPVKSQDPPEPVQIAAETPEDYENQKIEDALLAKAHKIENCTVTWYCNSTCGKSPDNPAYGITASGEPAYPHCTVATDTILIPMYSDVCVEYADGTTEWFKATDTGVSGAHVDIYTEGYEQAVQNGVQLLTVYYIPPVEVETD